MMNGYQGQQPAFGQMQPMQQHVNPVESGGMPTSPAGQQGWTAGMDQVANALRMRQMQGMQAGGPLNPMQRMGSVFGMSMPTGSPISPSMVAQANSAPISGGY